MTAPLPRKGTCVTVMRDGTPVQAKMRDFSAGWQPGRRGAERRNMNAPSVHDGFEDGTLGGYFAFEDEGSTWIRGWHKPNSPKISGLRVAWWMSRSSQKAQT